MNIQPDNFIAVIISSFGILYCLSVGIQLLFRKEGIKQTNTLLGLLLILYSLTLFNSLMAMTGVYASYQHLYFLPLVFTLSIGPLFYFFVRSRIEPSFRIEKWHLLHFILPLSQFLFYLIISVQSTETKSYLWINVISQYVQYIEETLVILSSIGYIYAAIVLISKKTPILLWNKSIIDWLKKFAISLLILVLISSIYEITDWILWSFYEYNLFNTPWLDFPLKMAYAIISWSIGFNAYIYKNQALVTPNVYQGSNENNLKERINELLEQRKVFLDPELKLDSFAKMLDTPKNTISKFFSMKGENFRKVINQYRVAYFIDLVDKGQHNEMSLLGLALESGFNSKASFNRIFKEQKGSTPSEYIRSHTAKN